MALSNPKRIAAVEYMITLNMRTVCPTGHLNFLWRRIATVSVPSRHPPNLITRPTPALCTFQSPENTHDPTAVFIQS